MASEIYGGPKTQSLLFFFFFLYDSPFDINAKFAYYALYADPRILKITKVQFGFKETYKKKIQRGTSEKKQISVQKKPNKFLAKNHHHVHERCVCAQNFCDGNNMRWQKNLQPIPVLLRESAKFIAETHSFESERRYLWEHKCFWIECECFARERNFFRTKLFVLRADANVL